MTSSILDESYTDFFIENGVVTNERYTINVTPFEATLKCHTVCPGLPKGIFKIEYENIIEDSDQEFISNWLLHCRRTDIPDLENVVVIIRIIMREIYAFIKCITSKFSAETVQYAEWYLKHGRHKRSDKDAHARWVTKMACEAILKNVSGSNSNEFDLYECDFTV